MGVPRLGEDAAGVCASFVEICSLPARVCVCVCVRGMAYICVRANHSSLLSIQMLAISVSVCVSAAAQDSRCASVCVCAVRECVCMYILCAADLRSSDSFALVSSSALLSSFSAFHFPPPLRIDFSLQIQRA